VVLNAANDNLRDETHVGHIVKGGGGPIGRNSIVKNSENFPERNAKNFV